MKLPLGLLEGNLQAQMGRVSWEWRVGDRRSLNSPQGITLSLLTNGAASFAGMYGPTSLRVRGWGGMRWEWRHLGDDAKIAEYIVPPNDRQVFSSVDSLYRTRNRGSCFGA